MRDGQYTAESYLWLVRCCVSFHSWHEGCLDISSARDYTKHTSFSRVRRRRAARSATSDRFEVSSKRGSLHCARTQSETSQRTNIEIRKLWSSRNITHCNDRMYIALTSGSIETNRSTALLLRAPITPFSSSPIHLYESIKNEPSKKRCLLFVDCNPRWNNNSDGLYSLVR